VKVLALTDHDTMAGVPLALKAAQEHRIRLIPGVEISAKFGSSSQQLRGQEEPVHILAYYSCCGPAHCKEMEATLLQIREGRYIRAQAMVQKLESLNKPIKWDDVLEIAGKGVAPCRPHVAQALVAAGHVNSVEEAFSRYLNNSGPAYVAGAEQPAADVVRLIHRTGGMAVLAHPWTLKHPFPLIERLKDAGLDAIEVYKSDGKDAVSAEWATAYELMKLGGSDFHGRGTIDEIDIGGTSIPALAMLQFLTVAQPIWSSALCLIVQEFAESTSVHDMDHEYWKGDIFVREVEGRFCLVFSAWLTDEEKSAVQNEARTLGLMHEVTLEQGFECISVIKVS